ncbi:MAG: penicillin-binding protein 2 [Bdellovibrio sp.]|nr:penicillin-binding protein 2 [Bdellovibrio sp.]
MKSKVVTLFIAVCFLWTLLIFRTAYLQFLPHEKLNNLQAKQFQTVITLPARRGSIFDRNGKELAMSSPAYSLYADPKIIENKKQVAKKLAQMTGGNYRDIYSKIKDGSKRFIWLDRIISASTAEEIRELKVRGLGLVEEWKRVYPNDSLLASTIGFVGKEGQALEGIELFYDHVLKGEKKKVSLRRDARGRPLIQDGLLFTETPQGKEMKLTVDADLQYFVESEMAATIKKYEADGGWVVVLDAKTSAIRAISSLPTFDANKPGASTSLVRRNRCVTDTFEPGSTLKTFVIADAIERNVVKPSTKIFCENGSFRLGKRVIHEAEKAHAQGTISVTEVLAVSSNIGTSKIALMLGDQKLKDGLVNFGFGQKLGVDLPGEAKGITVPLPWKDHLVANVSFGQGITVSPLQIANAYAAIANGGILNQPYIVESITDVETNETTTTQPKEIRRVISAETAAQMRLMLAEVTGDRGTGQAARVAGYIVGGKTGTAQKIKTAGRGYMQGGYIASFSGFIPANDPQLVIFVALDHPRKGYYGAQVAAPLFSKIASYAVRRNGVAPEILTEKKLSKVKIDSMILKPQVEDKKITLDDSTQTSEAVLATDTPQLKALTMREVLARAADQKIEVKFVGAGRVDSTWPEAGEQLPMDRHMTIFLK